jgi:hypothetical protein
MTRYIKIPVVNNEKEKTQIEEIFSAIERGDLKAVTSMKNDIEKLMSPYTDTGDNDIKTIELTDVEKSNNIQYLTLLRNSLKEFFYTKYGHSIRNTAKVAQQSKDEVNDLSVTSLILPTNMLKNRKQGWERVNALFGTNYTCEFSDLINIELMRTEEPTEPKEPETEENNNEPNT